MTNIKRKVAAVSMNQAILRKALDGLIKSNAVKTFKPINVSLLDMLKADSSPQLWPCTSCST
jgi:hypothetical protein